MGHLPSARGARGGQEGGGYKATIRAQRGSIMGEAGWNPFCSLRSNLAFMQTAGKTPSELDRTQQEEQRPGDKMLPLKQFIGHSRHLVGNVSGWLPERQQLADLLVHFVPIPKFLCGWAYCHMHTS